MSIGALTNLLALGLAEADGENDITAVVNLRVHEVEV